MQLEIPVSREILNAVASLDHFRGSWSAGVAIPPERLERLREATLVQSVAASCRMSGIRVTDAEVGEVLLDPSAFVRDKPEIRGHLAALSMAPTADDLLTGDALRGLHAVLIGQDPPEPSPWREQVHCREAFDADGTALGQVFQTLPPRLVPEKTEDLLTWLEFELLSGENHPLLVIGAFVLAFLAASPFERGNGRMSRVLAVRLLRRVGYRHLDFASFERVLEETRVESYEAYDKGETHIWTGQADLLPWLEYFLGALTEHSRRVSANLELEGRALHLSALQGRILETVRDHGTVDAALLLEATGANRNTLKDNMRRLVQIGLIDKTGERRGTRYRLAAPGIVRTTGTMRDPASEAEQGAGALDDLPVAPDKPIDH